MAKNTARTKQRSPARKKILESFEGPIERTRVSVFYQFALLIVAGAMVLLPIVYLALIAGVGYLIYYHAVEHFGLVSDPMARGGTFTMGLRLMGYAAPFLAGGILILFMIKPLFARAVEKDMPLTLDSSQEPLLFAFVEKLCEAVGAPVPTQIEVDCQVNASASFRHGWRSMFGSDLVLTIGMPLAGGLTVEQLAGVLAHEFGHFSQGVGMRLSYIVRSIDGWFGRLVYERDEWDENLADRSRHSDLRLVVLLMLTRLLIWFTRRILWVLMYIGHAISCLLSRQMEYDADQYEVRLVGSKVFVSTCNRMSLLGLAWDAAHADLGMSWQERRLADNLPLMTVAKADHLPKEAKGFVAERLSETRAGLFSTHPADGARIRRATQSPTDGVFRHKSPATALFGNYGMVANAVTLTYYRRILGLDVRGKNLIPTETIVAEQKRFDEDMELLHRYWQRCVHMTHPVFFDTDRIPVPKRPKETVSKLKAARTRFEKAAPKIARLTNELEAAHEKAASLTQAAAKQRAGIGVDPKSFGLANSKSQTVSEATNLAERRLHELYEHLAPYHKLLRVRLLAALQLARVPIVAAKIPDCNKQVEQLEEILATLSRIQSVYPFLVKAAGLSDTVMSLAEAAQDEDVREAYPSLTAVLRSTSETLQFQLQELHATLSGVDYPFDHAGGRITIGKYLLDRVPSANAPGPLVEACGDALDKLQTLYMRAVSQLARLAEQVERVVGLKRLPEPEEEPEDGE